MVFRFLFFFIIMGVSAYISNTVLEVEIQEITELLPTVQQERVNLQVAQEEAANEARFQHEARCCIYVTSLLFVINFVISTYLYVK